MLQDHELFASVIARLARIRLANDLTQETLRRSRAQLALSYELLKIELPKVWHPAQPKNERLGPLD